MENQLMSSPSSSVAQPEKCNDINVAVAESKEKATENNNPGQGSDPTEVMSERMNENPSPGSGAVPTAGNRIMQHYTSQANKIFTCRFCSKRFKSSQGVGGHMNAHRKEIQWENRRMEMEKELHHQWMLSGYSQDALSNDNHRLGNNFEPFKRRCTGLYPSFHTGLTDMNVVPCMAPTGFFNMNTFTNGSSSGGLGLVPPSNSYPPMLIPSALNPQENVLNEEDVILKLGNGDIVKIDDDDDAADHPEEETSKSWGADLSL